MRRRCAVGISDRSTDAARMRDGRLGGDAWPAGQPPPAKGEPPPAPVARSAGALGEPSLGGLVLSFGDVLGGQLLARPGMLVVHVLHLSSRRGCWSSTRLARTARSTRIRGMKVEAGLAVSNPRRSGTPRPRSTSQSGLLAFGSSSRCSSIRLVRALAVSVAMTRQVPVVGLPGSGCGASTSGAASRPRHRGHRAWSPGRFQSCSAGLSTPATSSPGRSGRPYGSASAAACVDEAVDVSPSGGAPKTAIDPGVDLDVESPVAGGTPDRRFVARVLLGVGTRQSHMTRSTTRGRSAGPTTGGQSMRS
jgi:hypothetical protein